MSVSVRVREDLYNSAKHYAKAEVRTTAGQIEYWARLGRAVLDNPDLQVETVEKLLIAKNEPSEDFEFIS
jgi:hypothetical protein